MDIDLLVRYVYVPFIVAICTDELTCTLRCDYDFLWQSDQDEKKRFHSDPINYVPNYVPSIVLQNASDVEVDKVPGALGNPFEIKDGFNFVRFVRTIMCRPCQRSDRGPRTRVGHVSGRCGW